MITDAPLAVGLLMAGFWVLAALSVVLALAAILSIVKNTQLSSSSRLLWILVILIFPLFGSLVYFGVRADW